MQSTARPRNSSVNVSSRSPHLAAQKSLQEFLRVSRGMNGNRFAALRPMEPAVPPVASLDDGHAPPTAAEAVLTGAGIQYVGAAMATKKARLGGSSSENCGVVVLPVMPLVTNQSAGSAADFGSARGSGGESADNKDGDLDSRSSVALGEL